jgi:hypothetical protein
MKNRREKCEQDLTSVLASSVSLYLSIGNVESCKALRLCK